jgi:hypothetical protein
MAKKLHLEVLSICYQFRSEMKKKWILPELCWSYELKLELEAVAIFQYTLMPHR